MALSQCQRFAASNNEAKTTDKIKMRNANAWQRRDGNEEISPSSFVAVCAQCAQCIHQSHIARVYSYPIFPLNLMLELCCELWALGARCIFLFSHFEFIVSTINLLHWILASLCISSALLLLLLCPCAMRLCTIDKINIYENGFISVHGTHIQTHSLRLWVLFVCFYIPFQLLLSDDTTRDSVDDRMGHSVRSARTEENRT